MRNVSHTNPYTGETAGHLFRRGPVVAADGGRREAVNADADDDDEEPQSDRDQQTATMEDVSHTPPNESENANRVFERGGSEDDVEYEE